MRDLNSITRKFCFYVWQSFAVGLVVIGSLLTLGVIQDISIPAPKNSSWLGLMISLPIVVVGALILWREPFKPKQE